PILAAVINKLYKLGVPETKREDLVQVLLTGIPKVTFTGSTPADELRINLSVPVTPADKVSRLGVLGGDNQGWPNGRRLDDAVALLLGGLSANDMSRGQSPGHVSSGQLATGFAAGDTGALVLRLQDGLRRRPRNVRGLDLLGLAYQQRARETGDPSYYAKSQGVLRRALALSPHDLDATSGLASLALSRHRSAFALRLGRLAPALSPTTAPNSDATAVAL